MNSLSGLKRYLEEKWGLSPTYVVVDNRESGQGEKPFGENCFLIQGDNSEREFSGWQEGLNFFFSRRLPGDVFLLANDSFEAVVPSYLRRHDPSSIMWKSELLKAVMGRIDSNGSTAMLYGKMISAWVNTNCFFVPGEVMSRMGKVITVDRETINDFLPLSYPGGSEVFLKSAPINDACKDHLMKWITREWYKRIPLSEDNWWQFREKVKAMLNDP